MRTRWLVLPGGRPDVSLCVPGGNLLFALVPGGLCSGFLGRRFQDSCSRNGSRKGVSVYKKKQGVFSCSSHLQNVSGKRMKKDTLAAGSDRRSGVYAEFFLARRNAPNRLSAVSKIGPTSLQ